jgi:tRNA threonylcarbamoyladenosine biosynthesis protein TsaB
MTRRLIIDTTTQWCSLCLAEEQHIIDFRHEALGRGHAEHLLPFIASLNGGGRAEQIAVSIGPGSFTGVRIGLAAARALGLAWDVPVLGYGALQALSAAARAQNVRIGSLDHAVIIPGGHGEFFVQAFDRSGAIVSPAQSLPPAAAASLPQSWLIGSAAAEVTALREYGEAYAIEADARHALYVPPTAFSEAISPDYARGADAKPVAQ